MCKRTFTALLLTAAILIGAAPAAAAPIMVGTDGLTGFAGYDTLMSGVNLGVEYPLNKNMVIGGGLGTPGNDYVLSFNATYAFSEQIVAHLDGAIPLSGASFLMSLEAFYGLPLGQGFQLYMGGGALIGGGSDFYLHLELQYEFEAMMLYVGLSSPLSLDQNQLELGLTYKF